MFVPSNLIDSFFIFLLETGLSDVRAFANLSSKHNAHPFCSCNSKKRLKQKKCVKKKHASNKNLGEEKNVYFDWITCILFSLSHFLIGNTYPNCNNICQFFKTKLRAFSKQQKKSSSLQNPQCLGSFNCLYNLYLWKFVTQKH